MPSTSRAPYSIDLNTNTFDIYYAGTTSYPGYTHAIGYKIVYNSADKYIDNNAFDVSFTDADPCVSATVALKSDATQTYTYVYSTETTYDSG